MKTSDLFQETFSAITSNKGRSALTILGIVIGIGSVIAMIAVGQGAKASIEQSIQSIGSNLLVVTPGAQGGGARNLVSSGRGSAQTLTSDDAAAISEQITLAKAVAPESSRRYQITTKGGNTNTQVVGTVEAYQIVRNVELQEGYFISEQQVRSVSRVAVIGPTTGTDLFGATANPIGQTIRINQISFKIIGVTKSKGSSGFTNQDDMVYIPLTTAQRYLSGNEYVTSISVQAENQDDMSTVQQQITDLLLREHNISSPQAADFSVTNQADIVATASSITGTFTILLSAIASISLIVGGIGIMNMMLTNVTERTREIGLRKAIGATKNDITWQFLAESVMLTVIGGMIGILLGYILSKVIAQFGGLQTQVTLSSVLLSVGVSGMIGIVFGYYPARSAAQLNPIEALRYE
jgi:putative ABC transport system permease protein